MSEPPEVFHAADGSRLVIRTLEDGDERAVEALLKHVDADDVRLRFFVSVRVFDHRFLWPLVHYDHGHGIALAAADDTGAFSGVGRLHCDVGLSGGEFALLVRSDEHRRGLGAHLLRRLVDWAGRQGVAQVFGQVLRENAPMLGLCRHLGFAIRADPLDAGLMIATLDPRSVVSVQSTTTRAPSLTRP